MHADQVWLRMVLIFAAKLEVAANVVLYRHRALNLFMESPTVGSILAEPRITVLDEGGIQK